ncbi:MAG: NUDIX domain-containing protein [Chthonomonadales bacterium]
MNEPPSLTPDEAAPPRWRVLARRPVYESEWVSLYHNDVQLPDGSILHDYHEVCFPRPAAGVVPIGADGCVLLVDHERFIIGERAWEVPAGRVDEGETPEEAARRELLEEAGAVCSSLVFLGGHRPLIGSTNARFLLYAATDVRQVKAIADTNEIAGSRWFTPHEVRQLLDRHELTDGMTITGILLAIYKGLL